MATSVSLIVVLLGILAHPICAAEKPEFCCPYCRSEPPLWVDLAGTFFLSADAPVTKMATPAAYLVNDMEEARFQIEGRDYKLRYAGAPLRVTFSLDSPDRLLNDQYFQVDLATPKPVGGILTQGGFYEERIQGLFPPEVTWVSQYVVSFSNVTSGFQFFRDQEGNVQVFEGNADSTSPVLNTLISSVTARYVRYHPIRGHNKDGVVSDVNVRVSLVICSEERCLTPKINCLMTTWEAWSDCACSETSCAFRRQRAIVRVQACGGARCGSLSQIEACVPPEALWKRVLQYVGIAMATIVVFFAGGFMIVRKKQKSRVEVIVVKETEDNVILADSDPSDDEADEFRDFEATLGEKGGKDGAPPPGEVLAPPPYTAGAPPGYMSRGLTPVN